MKAFVTGSAGFIGSHLVDQLLSMGHQVVGYDNFSTGKPEFIMSARKNKNFQMVVGDVLNASEMTLSMEGCDAVFHFAANADIRFGTQNPLRDFTQNTVATFKVLECMRAASVRRIIFASSSAVYGEATIIPTPENHPMPVQTSLYGASKLSGESMIQAYCEGFGMEAHIFRFVGIIGERYTHGHIRDFVFQLVNDPEHLSVLGDGTQRKSYLEVGDCVNAIISEVLTSAGWTNRQKVNIYNLGTDEEIRLRDSVSIICEAIKLKPEVKYEFGDRGWVGDCPTVVLDTSRIKGIGWRPTVSIAQGIAKTAKWINENRWALERNT